MFAIALFLVLPILWLLLVNWQLTLIGLAALLFVRFMVAVTGDKGRRSGPTLAAVGYLPRWNAGRRLAAQRELAQWQAWFDAA
jgi:hypothetical protein